MWCINILFSLMFDTQSNFMCAWEDYIGVSFICIWPMDWGARSWVLWQLAGSTLPSVMESAWGDKLIVVVSLMYLEIGVMNPSWAMTMKGQQDNGAAALVSVLTNVPKNTNRSWKLSSQKNVYSHCREGFLANKSIPNTGWVGHLGIAGKAVEHRAFSLQSQEQRE